MGLFSGITDTISSIWGGGSAADAKKAGKKNAQFIRQETGEQIRRAKADQVYKRAQAVADIRSSGFRGTGGTSKVYLKALDEIFKDEVAWLKKSGDKRAEIAKEGGQLAGQQITAQAIGTAVSVAGFFA